MLRFANHADEMGLTLPDLDAETFRHLHGIVKFANQSLNAFAENNKQRPPNWNDHSDSGISQWPFQNAYRLLSLARHSGLPTRLLDWTWSPRIAAYFAAVGINKLDLSTIRPDRKISVWCLTNSITGEPEDFQLNDRYIELIRSPQAGNINMFAQQGTFTTVACPFSEFFQPIDQRSADEVLVSLVNNFPDDLSQFGPIMWHIRLPVEEAPKVLWMLAREGIHLGRMFPQFSSVVGALVEERYREQIDFED